MFKPHVKTSYLQTCLQPHATRKEILVFHVKSVSHATIRVSIRVCYQNHCRLSGKSLTSGHHFTTMGKGKNAKRREKKRRQALRRAREEAAAAATAEPAAGAAAMMPLPNEAAMVEAMMNQFPGTSREQILQMRDRAFAYTQRHPQSEMMAKAHQVMTKTTSELHTSIEEIRGFSGPDIHVWHEVDGKIYDLAGGVDGDIQEYNRHNSNSRYTLRRAYPAALQEECFREFIEGKLARVMSVIAVPDVEQKLRREDPGLNSEKWKNSCVQRAAVLMGLYPDTFNRDTLRIGGVGWRDLQGRVHWEFG